MFENRPALKTKTCQNCNSEFGCGPGEVGKCWCSKYPAVIPLEDGKDCLCPSCFHNKIVLETSNYIEKAKQDPSLIDELQRYDLNQEVLEGVDYNYNEQGLMVLTGWYLLKRGYCCNNNCTNCPY